MTCVAPCRPQHSPGTWDLAGDDRGSPAKQLTIHALPHPFPHLLALTGGHTSLSAPRGGCYSSPFLIHQLHPLSWMTKDITTHFP